MNDYDFELFKDELRTAVKRVHLDKIKRIETYIDNSTTITEIDDFSG